VIVNFDDIVDLIGTGGFAAILLFLAVALVVGYGGGSDPQAGQCSVRSRDRTAKPLRRSRGWWPELRRYS
jgi:hypothetical protein